MTAPGDITAPLAELCQGHREAGLRFFAGLTAEESAQVLALSRRTVEREWTLARAWLHGEIRKGVRS